ncbi:hypothetical protein ACFQ1S_38490, partial [Kibdelosporangium lantanae]
KYAFDANTGNGKVADGQVAATQSSDAFFVWLSLPPSTFWVNLNPTEPDRIVDARLGTTDVGRILLEADFRMKKVVGRLLHPDSDTGKQFWAAGDMTTQNCVDMRQWIVPKPASVYEDDGGLYIVDAPLEVKMETQYLTERGQFVPRHQDLRPLDGAPDLRAQAGQERPDLRLRRLQVPGR